MDCNIDREIFSFCLYLPQSRDEGEELYQEGFIKAHEVSDQIYASGNIKSF